MPNLTLTATDFARLTAALADRADLLAGADVPGADTERTAVLALADRLTPTTSHPTVPPRGGTPWAAPHHHAPGFLASCLPCIRGEAHTP